MSTVTPPPPPVPTAPVPGLVNTTALAVNTAPQTLLALQALQAGQSLQATITAQAVTTTAVATAAVNQIQVQTTLGALNLQTAMPLPRGAVITLVLQTLTPQPSFQISTVNGQPVTANPVATAGATGTTPAAAPPALVAGQSVTATLLRPAPGAFPSTTPTGPTPTGPTPTGGSPIAPANTGAVPGNAAPPTTQGGARAAPGGPAAQAAPQTPQVAASQAAQAAPNAQTGGRAAAMPAPTAATPPATQAAAPATMSQPSGQTSGQTTTTLPTGTRFSATVQRVEVPNAAVSTAPPAAGNKSLALGQVITGTVTGRTTGGQPIVQSPTATFALGTMGGGAGALEDGAKITFRLDSRPLPPTAAPGAALRTPGGMHDLINAKTWDNLGDALKALVAADPGRLTHVAQTALPQPGPKLSSQMLFFMSALKGGDLKGLFGDSAMRVIDKERPGLLSRLGNDFQTMARLADEPQNGDWRLALIPMWNGEQLDQLRFFWRGGADEGGEEAPDETRFVLDLDFSALGHMQIDGLVKAKRHHLDLIIRTDQPLPATMRTDIAGLFEDARETLGLGGQVAFQAAPANFIEVPGAQADAHDPPLGALAHTGLLA